MSKTAFERDGILSAEERTVSAAKCCGLLGDHVDRMTEREQGFYHQMESNLEGYPISERQLAWLRDLVTKYAA